ncbi:hypothetical protein AAFO90_02970 [Phaeobacter sp. CAU 1743]|uniref:hypothetical protein n=1 Tax=Phaeobacter sp. CAU 1743 TaxID=3140367 RepID=UPI00325BFC2B
MEKELAIFLVLVLAELVMIGDKIFLGDNRGVSDGLTSVDLATYVFLPLAMLQMIISSFYEKK